MKQTSYLLATLSFLPHVAYANQCSCWSSRDCQYKPSCGNVCLFDWASYSYQCKDPYTAHPTYSPTPAPTPQPTPDTAPGEVCNGSCWSDYDCLAQPSCGNKCMFDSTSYSYRCIKDTPTTPSPVVTSGAGPTFGPQPTPSPTRTPSTKSFGIIPNECQVEDLIRRMEQTVEVNKAIAAQWLRLAFHDAGTFNQATFEGGANGCLLTDPEMREQPENHNLDLALEPLRLIKESLNLAVSNADLIQFAGFFTIIRQSGTPELSDFKTRRLIEDFGWGRPDELFCDIEWTLNLPGFDLGAEGTNIPQRCSFAGREIKEKMMDRNGFTAEEATALIGAHTIGLTRNIFGPGFAGPWVENGADEATPEGPVFDNEFHNFLANDVVANSVAEFTASRNPFTRDFPNWFQVESQTLNHLDTDIALALPSQDLNVHPHYHIFTERFANDNQLFLDTFFRAFDKMTRLGVTKTLTIGANECFPDTPVFGGPQLTPQVDTFDSDLQESLQVAEELLEDTAVERQEEIEQLTTPVIIG